MIYSGAMIDFIKCTQMSIFVVEVNFVKYTFEFNVIKINMHVYTRSINLIVLQIKSNQSTLMK